jgi:hypothetical protein
MRMAFKRLYMDDASGRAGRYSTRHSPEVGAPNAIVGSKLRSTHGLLRRINHLETPVQASCQQRVVLCIDDSMDSALASL